MLFVLCKCLKDGMDRNNSQWKVYATSDVSTRVDIGGWSSNIAQLKSSLTHLAVDCSLFSPCFF